jgi:N4-gp56 family major capsid protein|uniref:Major capsid protein n=1 Tax=Podoviridae sp. ct5O42 TaxID=2826084 RepID=A0A8D9UH64_9CAUD|nr:MAG TPA: major capsid protein [Podoviridae sp. ct5O42]
MMNTICDLYLMPVVLNLFDGNTNTTLDAGLSDEMKTYYSTRLINLVEPELIHDQFGQKHPIPKNSGKTIEFRKYDSLPKALVPLTEGVTPAGQKLSMGVIRATIKQYGGYIELSDILELTAIDNNLVQATRLLASQAGRTSDTITREVLAGGTNVVYAGGAKDRSELVGGDATEANNKYLSVDDIRKAVRALKVMNAQKINGYFAGIIHPDTAYDLMSDKKWVDVKTYSDPDGIYEGEIGKIEGVRFVETTEAKIFHAPDLVIADGSNAAVRDLTVKSASGKGITVNEALSTNQAAALTGREILVGSELMEVASAAAGAAGAATITVKESPATTPAASTVIYPGEGGAKGRDVYSTLIVGADAYGVTELDGGGLQHIVKQLGSSGTADPLNQRATAGWKLTKVAERLVEQYMVRIESASTFESGLMN